MSFQVAAAGEVLPAVCTAERFPSRVDAFMFVPAAAIRESLPTLDTAVGLLTCVYAQVPFQVAQVSKVLPAVNAGDLCPS